MQPLVHFLLMVLIIAPWAVVSHASEFQGDILTSRQAFDALEQQARNAGPVRVIVALDMPRKAKSTTSGGWMSLSDYIVDVQSRTLDEMGWVNFNDLVRFRHTPAMALSVDAQHLRALRRVSTVKAVYKDEKRRAFLSESVPAIGGPAAWSSGADGRGQAVAVIDTGVDSRHPFFNGRVVGEACFSTTGVDGPDFIQSLCAGKVRKKTGPGAARPCRDECEHGTHVAGIAAGKGRSFSGVAPGASLLAVQVFSRIEGPSCFPELTCLSALDSDVIQALEWVYDQRRLHSIAAVNLSLGGGKFDAACDDQAAYTDIIGKLFDAGVAPVIASGNEGFSDGIALPACVSKAIAVGATDPADHVAGFSNSATYLDLLAPGTGRPRGERSQGIKSSVTGGGYAGMQGTSMASPHVAGAFAVLRSAVPEAGLEQMLQALQESGVKVRDTRNGLYKSRISLNDAVALLRSSQRRTPPSPRRDRGEEDRNDQKPEPPKDSPSMESRTSVDSYDGIRVYRDSPANRDGERAIRW